MQFGILTPRKPLRKFADKNRKIDLFHMNMKKYWCFITLCAVCITIVSAQIPHHIPPHLRYTSQHAQIVQNLRQEIHEALGQAAQKEYHFSMLEELSHGNLLAKPHNGSIIPSVVFSVWTALNIPTASYNEKISQQCRDDSWIYASSVAGFSGWALKMYDATGKLPDGIASGNLHAIGHFDQCLKVKAPELDGKPMFTGKYCSVTLEPVAMPSNQTREEMPNSFFSLLRLLSLFGPPIDPIFVNTSSPAFLSYLPSIGFCLPSSCSANDIGIAVADTIGSHALGHSRIIPLTSEDSCTVADEESDFDGATIAVIVIFSLIALLLVLGTAYDGYLQWSGESKKELPIGHQIFLSFSVLSNGAKILDTNASAEGNLSCLHGMRFLSMTWVVLGHSWAQISSTAFSNTVQAEADAKLWSFQAIGNATVSVDTFFFLSGLLVAYVALRELDRSKGKFNVPLMYLHRYLRLTPVYALILAFIATLWVYVGSGPFWVNVVAMSNACRISWWHHLLYINNFFPHNFNVGMCMGETWYLANDMQMFLVSPLFIYLIWRWPKAGLGFLGVSTVGFIALTMAIIANNNLPPTLMILRADAALTMEDFFNDYYVVPWCRIQVYLVGIFMGYVFHKSRNYNITMKPWVVVTGWCIATAIASAIVYGLVAYMDDQKTPTIPEAVSVIYASVHRVAWAVSLSWVVFACVHGYGGFVNRLLSWSAFIPLSRLTYCTYLIHLNWLGLYYSRTRIVSYYTIIDSVLIFLATLVFSMGLAFIASVCIEAPFLNLEKLLFAPKRKPPTSKLETVQVATEGHVNKSFAPNKEN